MRVTCYQIWTGGPEWETYREEQPHRVFVADGKHDPFEVEDCIAFDIEENYALALLRDKKGKFLKLTGGDLRVRRFNGHITVLREGDV